MNHECNECRKKSTRRPDKTTAHPENRLGDIARNLGRVRRRTGVPRGQGAVVHSHGLKEMLEDQTGLLLYVLQRKWERQNRS